MARDALRSQQRLHLTCIVNVRGHALCRQPETQQDQIKTSHPEPSADRCMADRPAEYAGSTSQSSSESQGNTPACTAKPGPRTNYGDTRDATEQSLMVLHYGGKSLTMELAKGQNTAGGSAQQALPDVQHARNRSAVLASPRPVRLGKLCTL